MNPPAPGISARARETVCTPGVPTLIAALIAVETSDLLSAVIAVGAAGFALSVIDLLAGAPDLAITQVVFESDKPELLKLAQELRSEWVVAVKGQVIKRLPGKESMAFARAEILNRSSASSSTPANPA